MRHILKGRPPIRGANVAPMVRLVTGGTGFIGRHLLRALARRDGETYVLVRPASRAALEAYIASLGAGSMKAIAGDITQPMLGLTADDAARLKGAARQPLPAPGPPRKLAG